jgi:hypothetical protein
MRLLHARWKFRHVDPNVCCCGCDLGTGGDICGHGGCRSAKAYAITCHTNQQN